MEGNKLSDNLLARGICVDCKRMDKCNKLKVIIATLEVFEEQCSDELDVIVDSVYIVQDCNKFWDIVGSEFEADE